MNRVLLTARLTRYPEMRSPPSGKAVTKVIKATVPESCIPDHAVVQDASNSYDGACGLSVSPGGSTYDWQTVTTPNGVAKQVCQGVFE